MKKIPWTVMAGVWLAFGAPGCSSGGKNLAGDVCKKAETCNSLSGIDATQCADLINKSLQAMSAPGRTTAEAALSACLSSADCANLNTCIDNSLTGNSATGGNPATGGQTTATGGNPASGGAPATGGSPATGGDPTGGGSPASGGAATGGTAAGSGGAPASGGATSGGAPGSGGSPATGGNPATGGQTTATGGAGTVAAEPELITSAADAYWTKGEVTKVTSGTADLSVDKNTTYQRWDGFGGTFNEMGWSALSVVSAEIPNIMKLLFDAKEGANFNYGRIPLGASDYSDSWYTLSNTANDYTMEKFSIERDRKSLIPFIKAALAVRPDIHLWASPWVIPDWMKDGSNVKSDAQTMGALALYMARFVEDYAKEGLKVEAVHPQNEPGYARARWTQAQLIGFMKTYLGPTFEKRNLTAEVWCGTMSKDPDDTNIAKATALDAEAMKYVKGFGVQWNLMESVNTLAAAKVPVMQTEHRCGNYNFEGPYWDKSRYSSSKAQNDHLYGEESWQLIRDWIVSGVNSYSAWNMVLDTVGKSLDGWPQNALIVVDRQAKKTIVTAAYYVFRHFSQTILPGATRIAITGGGDAFKGVGDKSYNKLNAFAFKNPDGAIIVQAYNKGAAAAKTIVGVGSALSQTLYQFSVPAHGWATLKLAP